MRYYHGRNESTGIVHAVLPAGGQSPVGDVASEHLLGYALRALCGYSGSENSSTFFRNGMHTIRGVTCKRCRRAAGK